MSKQVQPAFFDLHVKRVSCVWGASSRLSGDRARASRREHFTSRISLGAKP
jgi:hypothetical protein